MPLRRSSSASTLSDSKQRWCHAFAAGFEEAGDAGAFADGLQQFDFAVADGHEAGFDALVGDFRFFGDGESEGVAVEAVGFVQVTDDDADVVDFLDHRSLTSPLTPLHRLRWRGDIFLCPT